MFRWHKRHIFRFGKACDADAAGNGEGMRISLIMIVEDDDRIRLLISEAVKDILHQTVCCACAHEVMGALREGIPDLLLLDLMLRDEDGIDILRAWKANKRTTKVPVIIISARSAVEDKVLGLELGAEDYITKPFSVVELQARVRAALRRTTATLPCLQFEGLVIDAYRRQVKVDGKLIPLTFREFELLYYLAAHENAVIDRITLLKQVWGYHYDEDPSRTVDYHIRVLRAKLGDNAAAPRYLDTVRGVGYRFIGEKRP